jgi:hypothetical protein
MVIMAAGLLIEPSSAAKTKLLNEGEQKIIDEISETQVGTYYWKSYQIGNIIKVEGHWYENGIETFSVIHIHQKISDTILETVTYYTPADGETQTGVEYQTTDLSARSYYNKIIEPILEIEYTYI